MIYDSLVWAFESEVITEVAYIKEGGLVSPVGGEKKSYFENQYSHAGNWTPVDCPNGKRFDYFTNCILVWDWIGYNI